MHLETMKQGLRFFVTSVPSRICSISLRDRQREEEVKAMLGIENDSRNYSQKYREDGV